MKADVASMHIETNQMLYAKSACFHGMQKSLLYP